MSGVKGSEPYVKGVAAKGTVRHKPEPAAFDWGGLLFVIGLLAFCVLAAFGVTHARLEPTPTHPQEAK
jgi:hypothetical protein